MGTHYEASGMDVTMHAAFGLTLCEALWLAGDRASILEQDGYDEFYLSLTLPGQFGPEYTVNIFAAKPKE